ncbi:MAG: hypothetical protein EU533_00385 [Promethearchaeota archaeon]|nr:MAG: hypothetical protein EU533_00385 [Candidatus Lokiarchaeota archaeon]
MKIIQTIIIYGSASIITILSIIYFQVIGYPIVNTATGLIPTLTPPIYMIPVFFPYGILLGEILWFWIKKEEFTFSFILLFECLIIGLISFIRYSIIIPFSGHAIIISFYLIHYLITIEKKYQVRILIGLVVLGITLLYKLVIWNDPLTLILGGILGALVSLIEIVYKFKKR